MTNQRPPYLKNSKGTYKLRDFKKIFIENVADKYVFRYSTWIKYSDFKKLFSEDQISILIEKKEGEIAHDSKPSFKKNIEIINKQMINIISLEKD